MSNYQNLINKPQKDASVTGHLTHEHQLIKQINELIYQLMKSEKMEEKIPYEFLPKKKRQLRQHL